MRASSFLFAIISAFFFLLGIVYSVWSYIFDVSDIAQQTAAAGLGSASHVEWIGTIALTLTGVFALLISFYLRRSYKSQGAEMAQDRPDANIDDEDPEMGFFSPWSWWPFVLGAALAIFSLGLAVGTWIAFIGAALLPIAVVGLIFEYYRGNFAR